MREKWFSFNGIAVFDHEEKRFWNRNKIKELAKEMWDNAEMNDITKNPTNKDLHWIFIQEFPNYTDNESWSHQYWDDCGRWEMIEIPYHVGFGIWFGDDKRFLELVNEFRGGIKNDIS